MDTDTTPVIGRTWQEGPDWFSLENLSRGLLLKHLSNIQNASRMDKVRDI